MSAAADSRVEEKRAAILACATKAFAHEGYGNTDVQVIADEANVGKGTVYRHFGTKAELFRAVADYNAQLLLRHVLGAIDGVVGALPIIRKAASAYGEFYQRHPEMVEILIQERATFRDSIPATHMVYRRKNRGRFEDILREGIAAGELKEIDVASAVDAMANCLYGTVVCGCLEGASDRLQEMTERSVEFFIQGIVHH